MIACGRVNVAEQHIGARALAIDLERLLQTRYGCVGARVGHLDRGELAMVVGDFLVPGLALVGAEFGGDANGLFPVLFLLIDVEQRFQRGGTMRGIAQLDEYFLGAVEQPALR